MSVSLAKPLTHDVIITDTYAWSTRNNGGTPGVIGVYPQVSERDAAALRDYLAARLPVRLYGRRSVSVRPHAAR